MSQSPSHLQSEYKHLDERQREAVCADIQPIWVNAGPGAGKTRVIVERIKFLIRYKNVSMNSILALTFTNKAAHEMQQRVMQLICNDSHSIHQTLKCETFHAFCLKILKQYGSHININPKFEILTDPTRIIKQILKSKSLSQYIENANINSQKIPIKKIIQIISKAKTQIYQNAQEFERGVQRRDNIEGYNESNTNNHHAQDLIYLYEITAKIYRQYEKELKEQNKLDFDDLLFKTMELFDSNRETKALDIIVKSNNYAHIVIDEFQDTNSIQFLIAKSLVLHRYKLFGDFKSLMVVGDHDQTIFSWRGSQNFHQTFKNTFKKHKEIQLNHNYRSTKNILNVANCIINQSNDEHRKEKKMITSAHHGNKVIFEQCKSDQDEAYFIISKLSQLYQEFTRNNANKAFNLSQTAILYRSTVQTRVIEEKLNQCMLQYVVAGGVSFYQRKEIVEITLFLKMLNNPKDDSSLIQIMKSSLKLFTGIGTQTIHKIIEYGHSLHLSFQETLFKIKNIENISDKIQKQIVKFLQIIIRWRQIKDNASRSVSDVLHHILKEINYNHHIYSVIKNKNEADERWQNVEEFIKIANEFDERYGMMKRLEEEEDEDDDDYIQIIQNTDKLNDFLQHIALRQPSIHDKDDNTLNHQICRLTGRIQLSTIHKAKGLEWDNVFLIGCSHGQLPHYRSIMANDIEEERRLAFVAVTRAQRHLFLSYAMWRNDHQNNDTNSVRSRTLMSDFFKHCPLESIVYNKYYDNVNDKKKKMRKNIFKKNKKRKRKKMNDPNEGNSMVQFSGFQKANKFRYNDMDIEDKGRKIREERAKMVEKLGTGFQKASALNSNSNNGYTKRKFKIPRAVVVNKENENTNICRKEVEKENTMNSDNREIIQSEEVTVKPKKERKKKVKKNKSKKRTIHELKKNDTKKKKKNDKPPKKKRRKNKQKPDPKQKLISSFFCKQ